MSVFSKNYWLNMGYSIEDAEHQIKIRRPSNISYWLNKGYSIEEAKKKLSEHQSKGAKKRTKEDFRKNSIRCVEYYLKRGYDVEYATKKISELQSTFSLKKCIAKHGLELGEKIWIERQNKWKSTLDNKNKEDKKLINDKKASVSLVSLRRRFSSDEEIVKYLLESRNMHIVLSHNELDEIIRQKIYNSPDLYYSSPDRMVKKIPKIQFDILNITDKIQYLKKFLANDADVVYQSNSKGSYRKWIGTKLLRSSYEILFHKMLVDRKIKCEIDGFYLNSSMRYDFYLPEYDEYIEIAPLYSKDEKYKIKMDKKREIFGCTILKSTQEFENFLNLIMKVKFEK